MNARRNCSLNANYYEFLGRLRMHGSGFVILSVAGQFLLKFRLGV
jgi:hypothetical protein